MGHEILNVGAPSLRLFLSQGWEAAMLVRAARERLPHRRWRSPLQSSHEQNSHRHRPSPRRHRTLFPGRAGRQPDLHRRPNRTRPGHQQVVASGITEQTTQVLENLKAILEAGGSSLSKAVKATVFLKDFSDFAAMNAVYGAYLAPQGVTPPARTSVEVSRLPKTFWLKSTSSPKSRAGCAHASLPRTSAPPQEFETWKAYISSNN